MCTDCPCSSDPHMRVNWSHLWWMLHPCKDNHTNPYRKKKIQYFLHSRYFYLLPVFTVLNLLPVHLKNMWHPENHLQLYIFSYKILYRSLWITSLKSCHVIVRNRLSLSMESWVVAAGANPSLVSGRGQGAPWTSRQMGAAGFSTRFLKRAFPLNNETE